MTIIDVSEFNGVIDWARVGEAAAGAIIRLGYRGYGSAGGLTTDARFEENLAGCLAAGIPAGVYWLTQARSDAEALAEADFVHQKLNGAQLSLPVFCDSEFGQPSGSGRADQLTSAQRTQYALTFLHRIQALGHRAGLYCSDNWFRTRLDGEAIRQVGFFIWLARLGQKPDAAWDGWQYSWEGRIPGISGPVDLSRFAQPEQDGPDDAASRFSALWEDYRAALQARPGQAYSEEARRWAVEAGLIRGSGSNPPRYMWGDFLTREQLVTVLYRWTQQPGAQPAADSRP